MLDSGGPWPDPSSRPRKTFGRIYREERAWAAGLERMARFVGSYDAGQLWLEVVPEGSRLGLIMRVPGDDAPYAIVSLGRDGVEGGTGWAEDLVWNPSDK